MERVRSKAITPARIDKAVRKLADVVAAPLEDPVVRRTSKVRTERRPDPIELPKVDPHGYGEPELLAAATGVLMSFRSKLYGDGSEVRLYYAGALLLGAASILPISVVAATFRHNLFGADHLEFDTVEDFHRTLYAMVQQDPGP